jgi:hypothetical protein
VGERQCNGCCFHVITRSQRKEHDTYLYLYLRNRDLCNACFSLSPPHPLRRCASTSPTINMPLGWERINVKQTQPNKNIVFIKPIAGPDENTAKDFLQRIAAQCLPVMNKHHLAVVSLEEYEPNLEFWGKFSPT